MSNIKLYFKYIQIVIRSQMAYKVSFILMSIGHFVITFIEFVGLYALFQRFDNIKGWTIYEIAIFYGVINISFALAECIGRGYDVFHVHVQRGTFDRILLRPRSIAMQILGSEFQLMRVGRLLQGVFVLIYGIVNSSVQIRFFDGIILLVAIIGGVAMFIGLMVFQATISFWSIQSLEIVNSFTYGGVMTAQYPLDIYKKWFQKVFIYLIPIGCVSYFPIVVVLRDGNAMVGILAPLLGVGFLGVGLQFFTLGKRYYCSTGS